MTVFFKDLICKAENIILLCVSCCILFYFLFILLVSDFENSANYWHSQYLRMLLIGKTPSINTKKMYYTVKNILTSAFLKMT
jgi:hypothetical protein